MRQRAAVATAATVFAAVLIGSSGSTVARVSQDSDPVVVLFIDDLHIDFRLTPRVRSLLVRLLRLVTHDGQHVGIVTTGYSSISLAPTPDRTLVLSDLRRITGGGLRPDGIIDKRGAGERLRRARVALATAKDTIAGVAARSTARTLIIYLSNGYGEPALTGELDELAVAASDANASIYTFDSHSLLGPTPELTAPDWSLWDAHRVTAQDSLRRLAEGTGGQLTWTPSDMDGALQRIADSLRASTRPPR